MSDFNLHPTCDVSNEQIEVLSIEDYEVSTSAVLVCLNQINLGALQEAKN